ncbi:hypothetical protein HPP92_007493 [Vanilla planifolia]|uniref:Uncharacterized protein n=1 Tax=Vanilla planifolia TaxID=51239 RepID=A0A835VBA8_VANPL|nr:hypothetical protein HPP92_007663 [Vanilla planifolia]KAG0490630.1 hypothetical protein HPP92_007493 [Vanilla planifolia]
MSPITVCTAASVLSQSYLILTTSDGLPLGIPSNSSSSSSPSTVSAHKRASIPAGPLDEIGEYRPY